MVIQAWQLRDFITTGHQSAGLIDPVTRKIIQHLTKDTFRPARAPTGQAIPTSTGPFSAKAAAREQRARSRSSSVDPLGDLLQQTWPQDWAVDKAAVRSAIKSFQAVTTHIRRPYELSEDQQAPDRSEERRDQPERRNSPSQTSADESIRRSHEAMDQRTSNNESQPIDIDAIITNAIARYVREHPPTQGAPGPPGPPGDPGQPGQDGVAAVGVRNDTPRFIAADVGFFDPFYDGKSSDIASGMEHAGKDTYFRDVTMFIDRLKDVARVKGTELLRTNLQICLRGEALEWYTCQLTEDEKRLLTYGDEVSEWSRLLLKRFGPTKQSGMAIIVRERYSLNDAVRHREPREYAMMIIRAAKVAQLGDTHNQLDVIWNGLDVEFQSDINPPTDKTTLNDFLASMDLRKQQWWTKAARMIKHSGSAQPVRPQGQSQPKGNSSQYTNQARGMPARPMNSGFQNSGFRSMNRQQSPAFPSQNYQAYNQYQNRPYENRQPAYGSSPAFPRRDQPPQQALPAPTTQRQITAGPNQNFQQNAYASHQAGNAYQSRGAPPYRSGQAYQPATYQSARPAYQQRAYQASIDESEVEHEPHACSDDPSSFHNDYDYQDFDESLDGDTSSHGHGSATDLEVNFIESSPLPMHACHLCKQPFKSRNKLFKHLKEKCWKSPEVHLTAETAVVNEQPVIVESTTSISPTQGTGTSFRGFQHTKTDARFAPNAKDSDVCLDPGSPITLGDQSLLRRCVPDFEKRVQQRASPVPVRGYGNKITNATEFIVIDLYFPGVLGTNEFTPALAKVRMEVHLTNDLKANMLIGTDVLTPHKFLIDCASQSATIGACKNVKIAARSIVCPHAQLKRTVKSKDALTLPPNSVTSIPISYDGTLPADRDYLFEPELPETYNLGHTGGIFSHVVDSFMTFVQAKNATEATIVLPRHTRLGTVVDFAADGCYQVSYKSASLATCGWRTSDRYEALNATVIDPQLEHVLPNGVTIYGGEDAVSTLGSVVAEYEDVFIDTGATIDIPEEQWMPIHLLPGTKAKSSKVYPLGQKDREVVDVTFDKLQQQGKLSFTTQPTPYSWPCFVVWRDTPQGRKGRVVIDIRGLNAITENDGYPLPLQSDIIALIAGYSYISTVDGVAWFHQFRVQKSDRSKLTIISHRGQEESSVALMGYKGSPPYVQRQTDALLRPLRAFVRAFVDDIIIFSRTLAEHESHLRQLFQLLREKRASLAPTKSFLGFPSVTLLGQRVDSLGMSTSEDKIKAITALRFPASLRDLEIFLGLTGWLRNSIPRYAQRAQPLQERKTALTQAMISTVAPASDRSDGATTTGRSENATTGTKKQLTGPSRKRHSMQLRYDPTKEEIAAFRDLQDAFRAPSFLAHFDRKRKLYVDIDASKVWGFAAMVYHARQDTRQAVNVAIDDQAPARKDVQAIMFLSKSINTAERNYWPTELEVAAIVWVVRKIRHMIEATEVPPVVIYSDHSAAVQISRQTTLSTSSTDKLNLRLVRASQYLSGFNLSIRHKAGKTNVVPDALSRLQASSSPEEQQAVLEALHIAISFELVPIYHTTLVEMSDDFKQKLTEAYASDPQWSKILDLLKQPELPAGIQFRKHNDLIYKVALDQEGKQRLCVPESLAKEVFKIAHDGNFHAGHHTTHARIAPSVYIKGLWNQLHTYIKHCPDCQLNQTKRHPTYGELNPIATPPIPFHTIAMDFIVALPYYEGRNMLLTNTCKFTKKKLLIPGFDEWSAAEWGNAFLVAVIAHDWGVPVVIISDRDSKFMSSFWRAIFQKLGTSLATSTAYHPQSDGQSERTNQTVEIALRFILTTGTDDWLSPLPFLQGSLNNSMTSTGFAPNELAYGFRVRDTLGLLADLPPEDLDRLRLVKREEADDAIAFANAIAKTRYDSKHLSLKIKEGSLVYLRLHHGYSIPGVNPKLSNQRVGPFKVLEKVGNLAYRLELPATMRIHPVISIAQLEPASDQSEDPYSRTQPPPPPVEEDSNTDPELAKYPPYEIERLLERRGTGNSTQYLVKWKGYGNEHNAWYPTWWLPKDLMQAYDARLAADPTQGRRKKSRALPAPPTGQASSTIQASASQASQAPSSTTKATDQAPRRRGRPKKMAPQIAILASQTPDARKRGRPRRAITTASAPQASDSSITSQASKPTQLLLTQQAPG